MTDILSHSDEAVPSTPERTELAHRFWKQNPEISQRWIARRYGIPHSTLNDRIHGAIPAVQRDQNQQLLHPAEEIALKQWLIRLQAWGWPVRVEQVRFMAQDILKKKGATINTVGINWTSKYLARHPELKTKYIPPLDKERALAHDPKIIQGWFELYKKLKIEFNVQDEDIYNMDEKGFMMGVVQKVKVMISKYEFGGKYMTQCGNRDWISLIECVSSDGRVPKPWIIFKAKLKQKAWFEALGDRGSIATSENGWTNNEIGLDWLQGCFDLETLPTQKGEYRMLCIDGHASHISTAAIEFALKRKIILLCLPSHSTHVLQSLDIGIFAPLATYYKNNILKITRFGGSYQVDKIDFIEQYLLARDTTFTTRIIKSAWQKTGLLPFEPDVVLRQLFPTNEDNGKQVSEHSPCPATPKGIASGFQFAEVTQTPANVVQVQEILRNIRAGVDLNPAIQKIGNACINAMASLTIEQITNQDLLELNKDHKRPLAPRCKLPTWTSTKRARTLDRSKPPRATSSRAISVD